ncbi:MAG: toxin-antitoxin system HicB family antitoxin [Deltaproteobacteria bacterium]|nr:toxin-antitoxin system HicB family antitoxin [Deltaproteobacteria bacterium]
MANNISGKLKTKHFTVQKHYSGKIILRVAPELHAAITEQELKYTKKA